MTSLGGTRILSPVAFPGRRATRLIERNLFVYRRLWLVLLSGFFEPLFYLLAVGFGVGSLIGAIEGPGGKAVAYPLFVAPAMLAASAMNGAIFDATFNFFSKLKEDKLYDAVLVTPLSVADVAVGEVGWALTRGTLYAVGFLAAMLALGLIASPWAILALPAALFIGFAFAALAMAGATFMRKWTDFDYIFLVTLPLFLFSATFFPLSAYPAELRFVVQLSPLYHGVELLRGLTLGAVGPHLLVHVAYLGALGTVGVAVVGRRLGKLLLK
ncbi:MAG: ABC transporter permease [Chloroflexota bacterium]|nr:ABC transporter permease [Chloroflexota bacterium]